MSRIPAFDKHPSEELLAEREREDITAHLFRWPIKQTLLSCYCFAHCNEVSCSALKGGDSY